MNINALPDKILARILSFLTRSDRLESALTCRRWAQIIARRPPLLRDIWLVIGHDQREEAETVFTNSQRQYENLRLYGSSFNCNATCWIKLGPSLRELDIDVRSLGVFHSILQACSNLESLIIGDSLNEMIRLQFWELPQGTNLESIQKSMRNMHHLQFKCNVDVIVLEHLLILMPNVSSIDLRRFNMKTNIRSRLLSMFGTSRLRDTLGTSLKITSLKLVDTLDTDDDDCEQQLKISQTSLRSLDYHEDEFAATELRNRVLDVLRHCSMLRHLSLTLRPDGTRLLHNILPKVPQLESFSFSELGWERFRRQLDQQQLDLTPIFDLRKLRKLYLDIELVSGRKLYFGIELVSGRNTCVPYEIADDLSRMISLESLTVSSAFGVVDSTCFRILASMPNLRELSIHALWWDAECLQTVVFGLRKLRRLHIRNFRDVLNESAMPVRHSELERDTSIPPEPFRSDRQSEQKLSSLEVLKMFYIPLKNACLGLISAHHSRLRFASLVECNNITDAGLVTLVQNEPLLEGLQVVHKKWLGQTFLKPLGELCRRLRWLEMESVSSRFDSSEAEKEFELRRPRVKCSFRFYV